MLFYSSTGDFDMTAEVDGSAGGGGAMFSFTKGLTSMPGVVLILMEGVLGLFLSVSASWFFSANFRELLSVELFVTVVRSQKASMNGQRSPVVAWHL